MLSYRHLFTKLMLIYAGYSLRNMLLGVANTNNYHKMLKIAKRGRSSVDRLRSWLKGNRLVEPSTTTKFADCWVHHYQSKHLNNPNTHIILLHGGGFIVGSNQSHGALASELAVATSAYVHLIEYPLFPEVKMQDMVEVCEQALMKLLNEKNIKQYVLFGDSAGGFLACQITARLIQKKLSLPKKLYLLSPLIQHCFNFNQDTVMRRTRTDDLLGPTYRLVTENLKVKDKALAHLGCSSVQEILDISMDTLGQFPPCHITYDRDEVLVSEIQAFIHKLNLLKVQVVDNSVDNGFHAFAVYNYLAISQSYFSEIKRDFGCIQDS